MSSVPEAPRWYEAWFDRAEYELVYKSRDQADARGLFDLIDTVTDLKPGDRVLDMACGRGRHARLFAERGYKVTGVDLSPSAIEAARKMAADEQLEIEFQTGDMRDAACDGCFDLVANLFTSFGYFDEDTENAKAIAAMARSLVDGGWLVQDFMNGVYWSANLVPFDTSERDGVKVEQRRWIERGRLKKEITLTKESGEVSTFIESVRLFTLEDFERMYADARLGIVRVFGAPDGSPYDRDSRRLIMFSRLRTEP